MRSILGFLHKIYIADNASERYRLFAVQENRLVALDPQERTLKRLKCARGWAGAYGDEDLEQSLEAYGVAIGLLVTCGWLNSRVSEQHHSTTDTLTLGKWGATVENNTDLPLAAAARAVQCGDIGRALEWLEQGRWLVWDQIQTLRTPLDGLKRRDPQLAQQMLLVWDLLEGNGNNLGGNIAAAGDIGTRIRASREWEKLLRQAREFPGFEDFLRPPLCSTILQHLPKSGPVVILNADQLRCDAIVLSRGANGPLVVPLLEMTYSKAGNKEEKEMAVRGLKAKRTISPYSNMDHLLGELWRSVVKPVLDALGFKTRSAAPSTRIWWCPTGPFTFLPIHASGLYDRGVPSECLADYAVSSYTPTVSALTERVKEKEIRHPGNSRLLLVGVPEAPDRSTISGTTKEVRALRDLAAVSNVDCLCLEGEEATTKRVMDEMSQSNTIHIACHAAGQMGVDDLKQSGFHLQDGRLSVSTIMKADLKEANLAFLSVCHTGIGDEDAVKEDFNLAVGMLAAGFRGVIATMGIILDEFAPKVAVEFYKDLLKRGREKGGGIDEEDAAFALHHVVQELKQRLGGGDDSFSVWSPYVHYGL
ncbi:CHAT domain-containing protein [Coprinopsis sp. MPI-PUGE-AT-0042]|nr:CHAT domain-containing protein [Coprinopsis sp. MPI-PUGE-AT-0042]